MQTTAYQDVQYGKPTSQSEQQTARYTLSFSASGTLPTHLQHATPKSPFSRLSEQIRIFEAQQSDPGSSHSTSKRTILLLCAVLLLGVVFHSTLTNSTGSSSRSLSAMLRSPQAVRDGNDSQLPLTSSSSSSRDELEAAAPAAAGECPFGSLPGTWVSTAAAGAHWQVLDSDCQLTNWLEVYAAAGRGGSSSDSSDGDILADGQTAVDGSEDVGVSTSEPIESSSNNNAQGAPPTVRILLLSDSVDRFIVQHVCDHIGGTKQTHSMHPTAAAEAAEAAADALRQQQWGQQQQEQGATPTPAEPGHQPTTAPTSLNKTAYAFHTCKTSAPLKLASSYFPGVHPTGPYHRFSAQNYKQRIDSAREMWIEYAGPGNEPDMVSVASLLWDIARIYMHERQQLEGREALDREVLDGWMKNFTQVVAYAKEKFPETPLWVTHTTMPPHHNINSGIMTKPYLGRRYFIHQLNAAAATAARKLGMQLVDYEALSEPFSEGQTHLEDLIHPNALVGLEVFNLMLNLAVQQQQQGSKVGGR